MLNWFKSFCLLVLFLSFGALGVSGAWANSVKNGHEILESLQRVTSVPIDAEILEVYETNLRNLPKAGSLVEVTEKMLDSVYDLSSLFCRKRVSQDLELQPQRRWAHKAAKVRTNPLFWPETQKNALLDEYALVFWGEKLKDEDRKLLLETLNRQIEVLKEEQGQADAKVFISLCEVFLTSPTFLMKRNS